MDLNENTCEKYWKDALFLNVNSLKQSKAITVKQKGKQYPWKVFQVTGKNKWEALKAISFSVLHVSPGSPSSSVLSLSVSSANRSFSPSLTTKLLIPVWPWLGWPRKDAGSDVPWLNGGLAVSGSLSADQVGPSGMRFLAWAASSCSSLCWSCFTSLGSSVAYIFHGWSDLQLEMWPLAN